MQFLTVKKHNSYKSNAKLQNTHKMTINKKIIFTKRSKLQKQNSQEKCKLQVNT